MTFIAIICLFITYGAAVWTLRALKKRAFLGIALSVGLLGVAVGLDAVVVRIVVANPSSLLKPPCGRAETRYGGVHDNSCN